MDESLENQLSRHYRKYPNALWHITLIKGYEFNPRAIEIKEHDGKDRLPRSFSGQLTGVFAREYFQIRPYNLAATIPVRYDLISSMARMKDQIETER